MAADLHVFHGVVEPMELPSSRYFRWAERLRHRPGAVSGARAERGDTRTVGVAQPRPSDTPPIAPAAPPAAGEAPPIADPRELERLTNQNGFMGFEYAGG